MRRIAIAALALILGASLAGCPGGMHHQPPPTVIPHNQ